MWGTYIEIVTQTILAVAARIDKELKQAMWLQTPEAENGFGSPTHKTIQSLSPMRILSGSSSMITFSRVQRIGPTYVLIGLFMEQGTSLD